MNSFAEVVLDAGFLIYRTQGGPGYSTNVIVVNSGYEQRDQNWQNSRGHWEYGDRRMSMTELHSIEHFFRARRGRFQGFRFRDWGNFKASAEPLTEFNMVSQGILLQYTNSTTVAQLYKKVWDADTDHSDTFELRAIRKPTTAFAPRVFKNGTEMTEVSEWEIDLSTGLVTFTGSFDPENDELTWEGEFDTPVRFDTDQFKAMLIAGVPSIENDARTLNETYYQLLSLPLVEIRV